MVILANGLGDSGLYTISYFLFIKFPLQHRAYARHVIS